ncbi:MAG: glycosyltransferase [Anaerolineae bacterium]|nr:glycosyltransferase [Anaerolineae bacterium]
MRLAVLIPIYNSAETIGDTLNSLLQCKGLDAIETVAFADDGSQDNSLEIAEAICRQSALDYRIIRHESHVGQWANVSQSISILAEKGIDWVIILHSDDLVKPDWIELMYKGISESSERVASVSTNWDNLLPDGTIIPNSIDIHVSADEKLGNTTSVRFSLRTGCWWHISGAAIRTSAFQTIGPFDSEFTYNSDYEWLLRTLSSGWSVRYLKEAPLIWRRHPTSVSAKARRLDTDLHQAMRIGKRYSYHLSRLEYGALQIKTASFALRRMGRASLSCDLSKFAISLRTLITALATIPQKSSEQWVSTSLGGRNVSNDGV